MQYICVFAGTSDTGAAKYAEMAETLGKLIVKKGYGVICGGANAGLMNIITNSVLEAGGEVIGVITPEIRSAGVVHAGARIIEEANLSLRKARMVQLAESFIALPGGLGTLDEITEIAIHNQFANFAGTVVKPVALLNADDFFQGLKTQLDRCLEENFLTQTHRDMIYFDNTPEKLIQHIVNYKSVQPNNSRWWEEKRRAATPSP
jgi:uncharacterized protein (TIGR00730 family)